jgi:hypothetical protein
MSIKSKVLAAAATLTMVGGVGFGAVATSGAASAATPSCGIACVNLFSYQFGTHKSPNYVVDVYRQGEKVGQPAILFRAANYDPAEDWTFSIQGTVADFFTAGLVNAQTALHYGCLAGHNFTTCPFNVAGFNIPNPNGNSNLLAVENEYAPFGVDSGLCLGVAATAFQGEGVTLQPCGVSSKTVWILDTLDQSFTEAWEHGYIPLINGSNTNFSHPYVLTYPANGFPTDKPRPQLTVTNLTGFSFHVGNLFGTGNDSNQLWGATFGELK